MNWDYPLSFSNTIVADNSVGGPGTNPDCFSDFDGMAGVLISRGHNLIGVVSPDCDIVGDTTGNLTGDPGLATALANNGGPTETLALLSTSQAIGAGDNALCEPTDQRGTVRPQGVNCDIGAFEAGPSADLSTTELVFGNQNVGSTSDAMTVTLSNMGTIPLTINSITVGGTDPGDYSQTNDCGTEVAVGGSCSIDVTFGPTAVGVREAEITVDTSANIQLIALIGAGIIGGGCSLNSYATPSAGYSAALVLILVGLAAYGMIRRRAHD
jgi:hypothetical protein